MPHPRRSLVSLLCIVSALLGSLACEGPTAPLSVQKGGALVLMIGGIDDPVGYGGTDVPEDYQRGTMVFRIVEPAEPYAPVLVNGEPVDLVARATGVAMPSGRAATVGVVSLTAGEQVVSVVDVPAHAPEGWYKLLPIRRRIVNGQPDDDPWSGPLHYAVAILPAVVPTQGGPVSVTSTPFAAWVGGIVGEYPATDELPDVIPRPAVRISLTRTCRQPPCSSSRRLAAAEVTVAYDDSIITVADAVAPSAASTVVWHADDGAGTVRVGAVNLDQTLVGTGLASAVELVFELVDGEVAVLDPTNQSHISATLVLAADQDGRSLLDEFDVAVSIGNTVF
jgi:hypothetical protein